MRNFLTARTTFDFTVAKYYHSVENSRLHRKNENVFIALFRFYYTFFVVFRMLLVESNTFIILK